MDDINQNSAGVSAGASINTNTNSDSSTQQADDFFAEYQNSIIAAMGLENSSFSRMA